MNKAALIVLVTLAFALPAMGEEFAIIKDSMFGTQKIEFYATKEEALKHFSGEGKLYRITRTEVPVKRIETRKKVEVTEYGWVADDPKTVKTPTVESKAKKPVPPK
jgi:hypothetical protein